MRIGTGGLPLAREVFVPCINPLQVRTVFIGTSVGPNHSHVQPYRYLAIIRPIWNRVSKTKRLFSADERSDFMKDRSLVWVVNWESRLLPSEKEMGR